MLIEPSLRKVLGASIERFEKALPSFEINSINKTRGPEPKGQQSYYQEFYNLSVPILEFIKENHRLGSVFAMAVPTDTPYDRLASVLERLMPILECLAVALERQNELEKAKVSLI